MTNITFAVFTRLSEVALTYLPAEPFILSLDKMTKKIRPFGIKKINDERNEIRYKKCIKKFLIFLCLREAV